MNRAGAWALVLLGVAACQTGAPSIANPSGACRAPNSGARRGYHGPAPGDTWLPDCQNTLKRDYWRVFATDETSAYTMPRIDGNPLLGSVCLDPQHELAPLARKYPICGAAETAGQVATVNAMDPADAQKLTRFLHTRLRFTVVETGPGIAPFPMPDDVLDACALRPGTEALTALCRSEKRRIDSGIEEVPNYQGPAGVELVARLNELYGIR
jgi:hypothetical protein